MVCTGEELINRGKSMHTCVVFIIIIFLLNSPFRIDIDFAYNSHKTTDFVTESND